MKDKKYYKAIKNTIITSAGTGIMAGMLLVGGNTAYAEAHDMPVQAYSQNAAGTGMHIMHKWNSVTKINSLAGSLGLDKAKVAEEVKNGKTLKQILQDNGIVPSQIQKAFVNKKQHEKKGWKKNAV